MASKSSYLSSKILYFKANNAGDHYIIPKRLNQDVVECFFSIQRQSCGGTNNMAAYTYGYNVNSVVASSTKIVSTKHTNVYDSSDLELGQHESPTFLKGKMLKE